MKTLQTMINKRNELLGLSGIAFLHAAYEVRLLTSIINEMRGSLTLSEMIEEEDFLMAA